MGYGRYHLFLREALCSVLPPQAANEHSGWPASHLGLPRPVQILQLSLPGLLAAEPRLAQMGSFTGSFHCRNRKQKHLPSC